MLNHAGPSLRTKRFRLVSEPKGTVEGEFGFDRARNLNENQKMKEGGGGGEGRKRVSFLSSLPALLLTPLFARSLTLLPRSLLLNRTETLATQATLGPAHEFSLQDV